LPISPGIREAKKNMWSLDSRTHFKHHPGVETSISIFNSLQLSFSMGDTRSSSHPIWSILPTKMWQCECMCVCTQKSWTKRESRKKTKMLSSTQSPLWKSVDSGSSKISDFNHKNFSRKNKSFKPMQRISHFVPANQPSTMPRKICWTY
jgi:hypothetical protein